MSESIFKLVSVNHNATGNFFFYVKDHRTYKCIALLLEGKFYGFRDQLTPPTNNKKASISD